MAPLTVIVALGVLLAGWLLPRAAGAARQAATRKRLTLVGGPRPRHRVSVSAMIRRWRARPMDRRRLVDGLPGLLEDVARGVRSGVSLRPGSAGPTAAMPAAESARPSGRTS